MTNHVSCIVAAVNTHSRIPSCLRLLQAEGGRLRERLSVEEEKLKAAEEDSERKDKRIEELQRLLGGMEQESATLRETIRSREEELRELRRMREEGQKEDQRSAVSHTHTRQNASSTNQ